MEACDETDGCIKKLLWDGTHLRCGGNIVAGCRWWGNGWIVIGKTFVQGCNADGQLFNLMFDADACGL